MSEPGDVDDPVGGEDDQRELRPSRSQLQRDASAVYDLGLELTALGPSDLDLLELPDELRAAIDFCKGLKARALSRHRKLIAQMLREDDAGEIQARFDSLKRLRVTGSPRDRAAQAWVTRIVEEGDPALQAFVGEHPGADRSRLRDLMRTSRLDPEGSKTKRARRELLRAIRSQLGESPPPDA